MLSAELDCRVGLWIGESLQGQFQELRSRLRSLDNKCRNTVRRQRTVNWYRQVLNTKREPPKYPLPGETDWLEHIRNQRDVAHELEEYEMKFLFRSIEDDDSFSDELRLICSLFVGKCTRRVVREMNDHPTTEHITDISSDDGG